MRKIFLPLLIALGLVLSACASASATPAATAASTSAPTASDGSQPTAAPTAAPYTTANEPCKPLSMLNDFVLVPTTLAIPEVTEDDWIKGAADASVTLLEYSDLQCPYCGPLEPILNAVVEKYPNDVRLVFRHWPLSFHENAPLAHQAAEAAGRQGKFFEMLDSIFADQSTWSAMASADFETYLKDKATSLGLDAARFAADLTSPEIVEKIKANQTEGNTLGLSGTPTLFINGATVNESSGLAGRNLESFSAVVELLLKQDQMQRECPASSIDASLDYLATITTSKGDIVIDLLEKVAPVAVNSFVDLAQSGWYADNAFYVVRDNFALTGDISNTGFGNPGYAFLDEISPDYNFDKEGVVGMYNFGPGTNGSQFFITKAAFDTLNGKYAVFGQVTEGMDVLKALTPFELETDVAGADMILSITISTR